MILWLSRRNSSLKPLWEHEAAQTAWACPAQVGLLSFPISVRTFQRKPKEHISWTVVLSWGVLEALRCLKAFYSFWGNSLFKRCSTDTNSPQELLADMRNHKVRAAHLINHGELRDPQWKPRSWPPVPAEGTLRTQVMFPSKQEQIQGSVYTFNLSFLLWFRKSLMVAGKLTVPVCPGLLLHAWQHSWLCWSLSQWLLLPLCPQTRGPSLKHQQWLLGRKKNVHVSKENNSSHSLGWCHLECPVGCGSLTGLHPAGVVGQTIAHSWMKAFTLVFISPNSLHLSSY